MVLNKVSKMESGDKLMGHHINLFSYSMKSNSDIYMLLLHRCKSVLTIAYSLCIDV